MKRIIYLVLAVTMAMSFAACTEESATQVQIPSIVPAPAQPTESTPIPQETDESPVVPQATEIIVENDASFTEEDAKAYFIEAIRASNILGEYTESLIESFEYDLVARSDYDLDGNYVFLLEGGAYRIGVANGLVFFDGKVVFDSDDSYIEYQYLFGISLLPYERFQDNKEPSSSEPNITPNIAKKNAESASVDEVFEKAQNGDFSEVAGVYVSQKFGRAEVYHDGRIVFEKYYIGSDTTAQKNVILYSDGGRGLYEAGTVIKPDGEDYFNWYVNNLDFYNTQLNGYILIESMLMIFPVGVPTVGIHWEGAEVNCPGLDTSQYRLVVFFNDSDISGDEVFVRETSWTGLTQ